MTDIDGIWRADPVKAQGPHRYADFFRDLPLLPDGQAVYLDAEQRDRLGLHCEAVGLRKVAPQAVKYWPPPRGDHMPGNTGLWVPAHLEDPVEMRTPDPAMMTPHEREHLRAELARFEAADHPEGD
ncbi:phage gene 29 protein family protein [Gordonia sp. (in: high G+C Gram-positive bacteria)]|uniref:phage gene 29 protein family protein n=1 Tax=Gordonia sp. (in: high G+C Gram-positive bacteria) TaxID=84139 RepID=UPI003C740471